MLSRYFNDLPLEIQAYIFYKCGLYDISINHYRTMYKWRTEDSTKPISISEIKYAIYNHIEWSIISIFDSNASLYQKEEYEKGYTNCGLCVDIKQNTVYINYIVWNHMHDIDKDKFILKEEYTTERIISYDVILLTPSTMRKILNRRPLLSDKSISNMIKDYITNIYNTHNTNNTNNSIKCLYWLILCLCDTTKTYDWLPSNAVRDDYYDYCSYFPISDDTLSHIINTFYNHLLDLISV